MINEKMNEIVEVHIFIHVLKSFNTCLFLHIKKNADIDKLFDLLIASSVNTFPFK